MKKQKIICSIFLFLPALLFAQNVTIKGKTSGSEGKILSVYAYAEQITYKQVKIASGKIDSAGNFYISFKSAQTNFTYLKIGFNQAPLYIEPGKTYDLKIECPGCNSPDDKTNPYLNPKPLIVFVNNSDSTELNYLINKFNSDYDDFIYNNYVSLFKQRNKAKIDTFRTYVYKKFVNVKNDYFLKFIVYRLASIESLAQLAGTETLYNKYILKQPVLYENTAYMEFFDNIFKDYILFKSENIKRADLYQTVNKEKSFTALMDSLGKDSILKNEVIRELVALKGLAGMYHLKEFDKDAVLSIFKYISVNSKFPRHKLIAANYIDIFTKMTAGTTAPDFYLKDYTGQYYSLSEFNKGKYVYIIFWATWCVPCITEMDLIAKLKEKYGTKVEFVGISLDKEFLTYYYFMKERKNIGFTTLHWNNNNELVENYDVKSCPAFILIGPNGKIIQYPAEMPSGNLDAFLYNQTKITK